LVAAGETGGGGASFVEVCEKVGLMGLSVSLVASRNGGSTDFFFGNE
jgi:hypothetical protein